MNRAKKKEAVRIQRHKMNRFFILLNYEMNEQNVCIFCFQVVLHPGLVRKRPIKQKTNNNDGMNSKVPFKKSRKRM